MAPDEKIDILVGSAPAIERDAAIREEYREHHPDLQLAAIYFNADLYPAFAQGKVLAAGSENLLDTGRLAVSMLLKLVRGEKTGIRGEGLPYRVGPAMNVYTPRYISEFRRIDDDTGAITFAGARFSLWKLADGEVEEIKGDRSAIGYRHVSPETEFTNHTIEANGAASFYLFTDGFVDQIGGKGYGLGKRRLLEMLQNQEAHSMAEQRKHVLRSFLTYQGGEVRRDDITMLGFRLNGAQ